jgi:hypothetical protein
VGHSAVGTLAHPAREEYICCTLKVTVVTCFLAALVVAAAACGGGGSDNGSSDQTIPAGKTFRGGGLSFTYPTEWRVRTAGEPEADADYQVKVGPRGRANDLIAVTVATVGVVIDGKPLAITEENIDENKELLGAGAEAMFAMGGGKLSAATRVTVGGLPGFRVEASNVKVQGDGRVGTHYIDLYKKTKTYTVSCVYTPEGSAEVTKACDQVLGSFRLSSS